MISTRKSSLLLTALFATLLVGAAACGEDDCKTAACLAQNDGGTDTSTPIADQALPTSDSTPPAADSGTPTSDSTTPTGDSATPVDSATGQPPAGLITVAQAAQLIATGNITLLDVRTPSEFASGHIEGAINMDWNGGLVETQWSTLPTDKGVLVYCRSGNRSSSATALLVQKGLAPVWDMQGGITAWQTAGMPVVQ